MAPNIRPGSDMISEQDSKAGPGRSSGLTFPPGFLWGAASSHFQSEGHPLEIQNRLSDWSHWTTLQGKIKDSTSADQACEFFRLYQNDIEICQQLNLNCFRLSLNWSAFSPYEGAKFRDQRETIEHYKTLLTRLKETGFKTFVTLFHFCLPQWLASKGGWLNNQTIEEFERFSQFVAEEYGHLVDYWLTINEPLVLVYQGYITGHWPPGHQYDYLNGFTCISQLLKAHARAYQAIKTANPATRVGFTQHWIPFTPQAPWHPGDQLSAHLRNQVFNHLFMQSVQTGCLNMPFPLNLSDRFAGLQGPVENLQDSMDFLGINYYTRQFCQMSLSWPFDPFGVRTDHAELETSSLGWETYPQGLYHLLVNSLTPYTKHRNGYPLDIFITENGYANIHAADLTEGDWSLHDETRVRYLVSHLMALHAAIASGANVKGYLHWSLTDNFEWAEGLQARFGLIRVAYPTQVRTQRNSAGVFARIAETNSLSESMLQLVPSSFKIVNGRSLPKDIK